MQIRSCAKTMSLVTPCVFALLMGMSSISTAAQPDTNTSMDIAPVMSGIIEGEILEVETNTLVVETENGKRVRIHMPGKSGKHASAFSKGEFIEADVSPEGITTSVRTGPHMEHK